MDNIPQFRWFQGTIFLLPCTNRTPCLSKFTMQLKGGTDTLRNTATALNPASDAAHKESDNHTKYWLTGLKVTLKDDILRGGMSAVTGVTE